MANVSFILGELESITTHVDRSEPLTIRRLLHICMERKISLNLDIQIMHLDGSWTRVGAQRPKGHSTALVDGHHSGVNVEWLASHYHKDLDQQLISANNRDLMLHHLLAVPTGALFLQEIG